MTSDADWCSPYKRVPIHRRYHHQSPSTIRRIAHPPRGSERAHPREMLIMERDGKKWRLHPAAGVCCGAVSQTVRQTRETLLILERGNPARRETSTDNDGGRAMENNEWHVKIRATSDTFSHPRSPPSPSKQTDVLCSVYSIAKCDGSVP